MHGIADSFAEHPSNGDRDHIGGVDIMYLKNVLLKFLDSVASGRSEQVLSGCLHVLRSNAFSHRRCLSAVMCKGAPITWANRICHTANAMAY